MRRKIAILFVLVSLQTTAQKFDKEVFSSYQQQYAEEQAIYLKDYESIDIKIVGDSLHIMKHHEQEMLHIGAHSSAYAKDAIGSSSFFITKNIDAKTLIPDKRKYRIMNVEDFKESYDKNSGVFYDDSKTINFYYPGVQQGAITQLSYDQEIKDPKFLSSYLFQSYLPVVHAKYTITADKGVSLRLEVKNDNENKVKQSVVELDNGRMQYTFESFDNEKLKFEEDAAPIRFTEKHVISLINSYEIDGKEIKVLSSVDDLFSWYSSFIKGLKEENSENIQAIVNDIIDDNDSELEKVRKIFYWVQNNIKYIAFEDGMRGLIPHKASYVCDKRYGDCKDMATIVINMLHAAGVPAYFTWIGTRDIPYKYSEYPSPMVDNHMIATYINGDDYYFLDATSQYSSFELPSGMIQGKEALIARDLDTYEIKEVPIISYERSLRADTLNIQLTDGTITGNGKLHLSGYPKVYNSYRLIKSNKKDVDDFITNTLEKGSNKFFIDDYQIENLEDLDQPILINYQFRIEDYFRTINNKIYLNLNLDKSMTTALLEESRKRPKELEFKVKNTSHINLKLPEGFKINRMPENINVKNDVFDFSIQYTQSKGSITLTRIYKVKKILLTPEDFQTWNEAIKQLNNAYRDIIILEKEGA